MFAFFKKKKKGIIKYTDFSDAISTMSYKTVQVCSLLYYYGPRVGAVG